MGYQSTAETFLRLLTRETVWFLLSLLLLRALLLRWFLLSERRLRLESAIRHREEALQEREQEETPETDVFDIEVPEPDYKELGQQARAMVRVAVFVGVVASLATLWGDFLPFYNFLENVTLPYTKTSLVEGVEEQVPATLADLILGLLMLAATGFAVKNLAGLLEFTVLRHFNFDAGARYALSTLLQYGIVTFGLITALSTMGMEWQKLQWLVAALGVGLGFGLQEIVANFVSGIILLIERPIRVGDIVTVGNASGAVSRIQIRATTIQTYDSQELLVPNKEFITGRLLNWTLTDPTARILLYVGIAYGSDVEKALKLIMEAAVEEDQVLEDPAPTVNFEGFGENALNLSLRAFVGSLDFRLAIQTSLLKSIYAKFAAAGIEISFPQRDVHLDTREPLEIRVVGDPRKLAGGNPDNSTHT
jgi:potassium efflux system protein